jgi:3-ketosteroid 9alpha-monooxygenase subunit A
MDTTPAPPAAAPARPGAPSGYPWGWFVVAFSEDIAPGQLVRLRYWGRELVAFRGPAGEVAVLDAFCPHLGAHLGVGGVVVEGQIRCPFHAWQFGGDGRCTKIPYSARPIPERARVHSWPVCERNGIVHVWYHPDQQAPSFEVPTIDGWGAEGWTAWRHSCLEVRTHPREIVENVVDVAHFAPVHATEARLFENEFQGHLAIQKSEGVGSQHSRFPGAPYKVLATYHGPGLQLTEFDSMGMVSRLLNAHTMIDAGRLHLRFGVMLRSGGDAARSERSLSAYVRDLQKGFEQDIAIWTNKTWRDSPVLCDGDGPIIKLRRWYRQFFA